MILRLALPLALLAAPALAHHGWGWTAGDTHSVTGTVTAANLGNPHGILTVEAEGEEWTVEVGQPWRNAQAGLSDDMLAPGAEVMILGERHADPSILTLKAEVVVIDGTEHVLYPDRV